ncbi:MAG TPA: YihY/virulence factor BrkB family protein [Polyangiaceae bacterium]
MQVQELVPKPSKLSTALGLCKQTGVAWDADNVSRLAASLAYYTLLSIAPFVIFVIFALGLLLGEDSAREHVGAEARSIMGSGAARAVEAMVTNARAPGTGISSALIGLAVLLFGASAVFAELQSALNTVWRVQPKPGRGVWGIVKDRFFSFTMVLGVAFLLLVSLIVSAALSWLGGLFASSLPGGSTLWSVLNFLISLGVIALLFALLFKIVPDVKITWHDVWVGAFVTAALFSIGKFLLGLYLGHAGVSSVYGAAGSIIALVIWVYYSAQILLLGAEFTRLYARHCGSRILPADGAVAQPKASTTAASLADSLAKQRAQPSQP